MKETRCPRCGESVVFVDYGDNPAFLTGECQACHLKGEYLDGQGFTWNTEKIEMVEPVSAIAVKFIDPISKDDNELRIDRAKTALRKAIQSENAKYNPCVSLINAYQDGLDALEGLK